MRISRHTALFFDASVLIAGAGSPEGGSALLLEACKAGGFRATTSTLVIHEAEENLGELFRNGQFPAGALVRFYGYLRAITWKVVTGPSPERVEAAARLIDPGDAHVLAAALESGCDFLLTLDVRHFKTEALREADLPFAIVTPKEFIQSYYHLHESYPELPPRREG